jgi:hypothetical protein
MKFFLPLAPDANCRADKKLPGCEPSGSVQHNTERGRPEHDNPTQGSQQLEGSSNKGSSSQSSRPGSTLQSSQKSSSKQGNELAGGSKQGSQPASSKQGSQADSSKHDDGWQVVTSRRKNKASTGRNK